uniref:Ribosomal protein S20 n=1 Tax=Climaconeis sp. TaxID=2846830 RepID=A0A8F8SPD9_9STRA|nr:ribosomal protein S20 [Climaconeis sp.]
MANNKSAKKRIKIYKRNYSKNRFYKISIKTLTKIYLKNLNINKISKNSENTKKLYEILNSIYCLIDKGTNKNVFHKNNAARKKSRLKIRLIKYLETV